MRKALFVSIPVLFIVGFFALPVIADDTLVRFDGGIGSIPVRLQGGVNALANDVRGINPGGRPWVIDDLRARVKVDGRIKIKGKGLLLGGGGSIGTSRELNVIAMLLCENAVVVDVPVEHNTDPVALKSNGDFKIDDVLIPMPPNPCDNPVLLIRSSGSGSWCAAGIPDVDDDDDGDDDD